MIAAALPLPASVPPNVEFLSPVHGSTVTAPTDITGTLTGGDVAAYTLQLAFEDLNIPLVGIPVQLLRSYDNRGTSAADFGPDWELGFRSVQVQTSEPVGEGWEDYVTRVAAGVPFYGVRPVRRHVVSVVVGDEVQQFEAYSPTEQGFFPLEAAAVAFRPINGSVGTLTLQDIDTSNLFITRSGGEVTIIDFTALGALDPEEWVYRTADGTRLDIRRVFGLRKLTDPHANTLTFTEDGITHSSGESVAFTRDAAGRITAVTAPGGVALGYAYDAYGYLAAFTNRAGEVTAFDYVPHPADPDSGRRLLHAITDPLGNRALAAGYGDDGRLISQTDAAGNAVTFGNDIPNRRQTVTDRLGNVTVHEYDLRGNIVRTVDPLGGVTLRGYDDFDNETSVTDPLGNVTTRTYDANRNKLTETDPLGHTVSFSYDAYSQPTTNVDARGNATVFTYDANGNLTSDVDPSGNVTRYTYDGFGDLLTRTDALGNVTEFAYDASGRVTATVIRDASANVLRREAFSLDARGNRTESRLTVTDTPALVLTNRFEYDAENRPVKTTRPDGTVVRTAYDALGKEVSQTDALGRVTRFTYDARGNRIRTDHPDGTSEEAAYDAENRKVAETDRQGRRTEFYYDALGRLTDTIRPDGAQETSVYDAIGRVVTSLDALGNATEYEYAPGVCCSARRGKVTDALGNQTLFDYDENGNMVSMTDADGHTTLHAYDGNNRQTAVIFHDGTANAYLYCGEQWDADLGLYYNRARYLNTDSGRFWTRDVYEGTIHDPASLHKYLYAGAEPVKFIDPSGQFSISEIAIVQDIRGMLERTRDRGIYQMTRKGGCYLIEYAAEELISTAIVESGFYLFSAASGLPYVGRSINVERRLLEHEYAGKLAKRAENIFAKFRFVGTEQEMRNMEQWLIDKLKGAVELDPNRRLNGNGLIENRRNELGKSARQKIKEVITICK